MYKRSRFLPPWNYHNLPEIQAARHDYSFQLLDDVASVMQQHASSNCLHFLAGMGDQIQISCDEMTIVQKPILSRDVLNTEGCYSCLPMELRRDNVEELCSTIEQFTFGSSTKKLN